MHPSIVHPLRIRNRPTDIDPSTKACARTPQLRTPHAVKELARRAKSTSALGDFAPPLASVHFLVGIEPCARALVGVREWLPSLQDITGRGIEVGGPSTLVGAAVGGPSTLVEAAVGGPGTLAGAAA